MSDDILPRDAEYYIDLNGDNYPYYYGRTGEDNRHRIKLFSYPEINSNLVYGYLNLVGRTHIRVFMRDIHVWHYHPDELTKLTHEEAESMIVLNELQ